MPILLSELLQADQKKAVEYASGLLKGRRTATHIASTEFYNGNHFQNGEGWIGEKPILAVEGVTIFTSGMAKIKQGFVSENAIKEVVNRHVNGILGREPLWGFVPQKTVSQSALKRRRRFAKLFSFMFQDNQSGAETDKFAQEADEALTVWWDQYQPRKKLKEAIRICLNEERVLLRFFIPRGLYNKDKPIPVLSSLTDALALLRIDVITADKGGVFLDTDTQKPFGIYVYQSGESTVTELTYVDELGRTVLQILSENPDLAFPAIPYDLQGRLWMYELTREALITEQVHSQQKSLNLAKTMMMRNINLAGSRERYFLNAERPSRKVKIADSTQATGYREEKQETALPVGAGVSNFIDGVFVRDKDGKIVDRADPNVSIVDPVNIETFVGTRRECRESILGETQQLHILISGDSTVSGRSREQARAEYRGSLQDTKEPLDDGGRFTLETPLRIAAQICGRQKDFAGLRCDFDSRIEDGPVSSEERSANREDVKANLMSPETAMSRNGIEDTDAEATRIADSKAAAPVITDLINKPVNGGEPLPA